MGISISPNGGAEPAGGVGQVVQVHVPTHALLQESDPSKTELVNPGEYQESTSPVEREVDSASGGVGTDQPRGGYKAVMIRATIPGVYRERELDYHTETIQSVDKIGNYLVFTTTTPAGKLRTFKVLPHGVAFIP